MDTVRLRAALRKMSNEELENVREIVSEESGSRGIKREYRNKFLVQGTKVRMMRAGTRLPRGAEGSIIRVKRKKAVIHFEDFGNFDVPLSMFEEIA